VVEQVRVALAVARHVAAPFPSALLTGPPGLGQSQVARCIAAEAGTDFIELLGQAIREPADLNAVLLSAAHRAVVHVDEAHELEKEFQSALYLALDQKKVLLNTRSNRGPQAIPLNDFSILLSTTDEYCLLQPLRDRMRLVLRLQFYADAELVEVAGRRADALGWAVEGAVLPEIARRARGTPRIALRLLQACRRVCRAAGEDRITPGHLRRACELEGTDPLGLGPTDQEYLAALAGGATRLNVVASRLGLPARTVAEVVEPFLIRSGLICKDDQGRRELTGRGRDHLRAGACPEVV
jgi:Holliday junction DNA helicase RuvB